MAKNNEKNKTKNTKAKDAKAKDAKAKDAKAKDTKAKDVEVKDAEAKDTEAKDVEVKDAEVKDTKAKDTKAKDVEVKDAEVKDTEVKDVEVKDVEVKDVEVKDAEVKDVEVKDVEVKDVEVKDAEVKDVEVKDVEVKDTEVKNVDKKRNLKINAGFVVAIVLVIAALIAIYFYFSNLTTAADRIDEMKSTIANKEEFYIELDASFLGGATYQQYDENTYGFYLEVTTQPMTGFVCQNGNIIAARGEYAKYVCNLGVEIISNQLDLNKYIDKISTEDLKFVKDGESYISEEEGRIFTITVTPEQIIISDNVPILGEIKITFEDNQKYSLEVFKSLFN